MNQTRIQCLAATAAALVFTSSPAFAQTDQASEEASPQRASIDFLDLTASLGYSSNPFLRIGDSKSSVFGRVSARGVHAWNTELSSSSISAFVEGSTYFNDYGLKSIFAVNGNTSHQVSETVRVFGSAGVSGDLSGQLSRAWRINASLSYIDATVMRDNLLATGERLLNVPRANASVLLVYEGVLEGGR